MSEFMQKMCLKYSDYLQVLPPSCFSVLFSFQLDMSDKEDIKLHVDDSSSTVPVKDKVDSTINNKKKIKNGPAQKKKKAQYSSLFKSNPEIPQISR